MPWTLAVTAAATLLSAGVYGALAVMLWNRAGGDDARRATRAFGAYWGLTAAYQAVVALQHAAAAAGIAPLELALAVRYLGLGLASLAIGGLLGFFAYLRTGDPRWPRILFGAYAGVALLSWIHVWRSEPIAVARTDWTIDVAYAGDFQGGLFVPLLVFLNLLPILGALWYLTLTRAAEDRAQRRRIVAVGAGIALQLLSFTAARLTEDPVWQLVSRTLLALVVTALVASAYQLGSMPAGARMGGATPADDR